MKSDKLSKPGTSPNDPAIEPKPVDTAASVALSDLFLIEWSPAAVAAFNHRGRRLDALIEVANSQAADLRATLRELIAGHPSTGQADAVNSATLKAVLAAIS
jgi:hypothetical protein